MLFKDKIFNLQSDSHERLNVKQTRKIDIPVKEKKKGKGKLEFLRE